MTECIWIGDPPVELKIRSNPRAKRYSLRISPKDHSLWLTVPVGGSRQDGVAFAESKLPWVRQHLARLGTPPDSLDFGQTIPIAGEDVRLEQGPLKLITGQVLFVPGPSEKIAAQVKAFLKVTARDVLVPASEEFAKQLERPINAIRFRDTSSRWGSCTSEGTLMYSIRLAMAPISVAKYVAAHEACHLVEMNHSARFWALVEDICPGFRTERAWLKKNGPALQMVHL